MERGTDNTFSITEIVKIFDQIDARILKLHECSNDDFTLLNKDFKLFYRQSKELESNASQLFSIVSGSDSSTLLQQLKSFYQQLETNQKVLGQFSKETKETFESILTSVDSLFFPLKNLSQDLMTVKFLIANQLLNEMCEDTPTGVVESSDITSVLTDIKQACINAAKLISNYKVAYAKADSLFDNGLNSQLEAVDEILEKVHTIIILYGEKYEGAQGMLNELSSKSEQTTSSIAEIITKLQYQDIIRQKMEHIQASHRSLMQELNTISTGLKQENRDAVYSKIKDIAALQAAQLIHANKEYQGAIESITENFMTIGDTLSDISFMCRNFTAEKSENEDNHYLLLTKKLEKTSAVIQESISFSEQLVTQVLVLEAIILELLPIIAELPMQIQVLRSKLVENGKDADCNEKTVKQIRDLITGIDSYNQNVVTSHANLSEKLMRVTQVITKGQVGRSIDGAFFHLASDLQLIVERLKVKSQEVYGLLERNQKLGNEVKCDIKKSIETVKYYDFFETVIIEIIRELDEISQKVAISRVPSESVSEHLLNAKKLYTMASEHAIHDKIVNKDLGNIDPVKKEDTEDSEIEFF